MAPRTGRLRSNGPKYLHATRWPNAFSRKPPHPHIRRPIGGSLFRKHGAPKTSPRSAANVGSVSRPPRPLQLIATTSQSPYASAWEPFRRSSDCRMGFKSSRKFWNADQLCTSRQLDGPPSRANFKFLTHRSFTSSAAPLVICFDSGTSTGAADLSLFAQFDSFQPATPVVLIGTFYLALRLHVTATHTERDWPQIG